MIPETKGHKDPEKIDLSVPRRAQYLHNAWKRHQDAVFEVDINLAIRKGLTFCQTRSNAIILQGILPAYCIPKVVRLKTGEVLYEKAYMSPRPPPKISLRHEWKREMGSKVDRQPQEEVAQQPREEVAQQPRREVSRQAKFFQPTQPIPKPICDRSGQPDNKHEVFVDEGETSWSREIKEKSSHEELCSSDRSGQPDITPSVIRAQTNLSGEIRVEQTHDRSGQPGKHEIVLRAAPEVHREITTLNTDNELTLKSFTLIIPWNSAKLVKISPGIIARLHHIDRRLMVLRKEQCAE